MSNILKTHRLYFKNMDLRHLRYFIAVAEELHFTRAAQRIGIAQPPLTFQIKVLEKELGVPLFNRQSGRVSLTEPGRVYLVEARAVLEQVRRANLRCQQSAQGVIGRLSVGFTESASFRREVTDALHRYRSLYPQVELALEESRTGPLVESVREGRIDLAFVRLPIDQHPEIQFSLVCTEAMVVVVPAGQRLAGRTSLRLEDLSAESFVLYPRATRSGLPEMIVSACEAWGFQPQGRAGNAADLVHHQPGGECARNLNRAGVHAEKPVRRRLLHRAGRLRNRRQHRAGASRRRVFAAGAQLAGTTCKDGPGKAQTARSSAAITRLLDVGNDAGLPWFPSEGSLRPEVRSGAMVSHPHRQRPEMCPGLFERVTPVVAICAGLDGRCVQRVQLRFYQQVQSFP